MCEYVADGGRRQELMMWHRYPTKSSQFLEIILEISLQNVEGD